MQADPGAEAGLIRRVRAGDRAAFVTLVQSHQRLVERIIARLLDDPRDREEVCQDTFLRVYRGLDGFRGDAPFAAWVARIAHRSAVNRLSRRRPAGALTRQAWGSGTRAGEGSDKDGGDMLEAVPAEEPDPHERVATAELQALLRLEIAGLSPVQRTILTLYHLQEMQVEQIAAAMEMPSGTVKSHLFRTRRQLKERLLQRYTAEELIS